VIFKMFASENRDKFPGQTNLDIRGWSPWFGVNSRELYPEYWSDPNIAICPSDSRADWGNSLWGVPLPGLPEQDLGKMLDRINGPNPTGNELCRHTLLSFPYSYIYNPYAVRTGSQFFEVFVVCGGTPWHDLNADPFAASNVSAWFANPDIEISGCPPHWDAVVGWRDQGQVDITEALINRHSWVRATGFRDDDGAPLPSTYHRLKEGIERFFITDI